MWVNRFWIQNNLIFLMAVGMILASVAVGLGESAEIPDEVIVATGDGFVLTQKTVDAYSEYFASLNPQRSQKEIISSVLKYELLFREYSRNQQGQVFVDGFDNVAAKIAESNKYIQKVLSDWIIPSVVIESYYRANPEKYSTGTAPDGRIYIKPLDDAIRNEIQFMIIESKKEIIVKEFVDSLIHKYHIKINK